MTPPTHTNTINGVTTMTKVKEVTINLEEFQALKAHKKRTSKLVKEQEEQITKLTNELGSLKRLLYSLSRMSIEAYRQLDRYVRNLEYYDEELYQDLMVEDEGDV